MSITINKIILFLLTILLLTLATPSFAKPNLQFEIIGIDGDAKKNVEAMLAANSAAIKTPAQIHDFYRRAPEEVKKALQPFGYFRAHVHTMMFHQPGKILMRFIVTPGPPLLIRQIDFTLSGPGKNDPVFKKILDNFPLVSGQIFSVPTYNAVKKSLRDTALQYGYFEGNFQENSITIDLVNYNAVIILHYATGIRYRFGKIFFNDHPYREEFLRRFADFKTGQYYDIAKVQRFQENLSTADYFQRVSVEPQLDDTENYSVPLAVHLVPLPRREYELGLGFGTDTGPRTTVNYIARQLTSDGQLFKAQLQASQIDTNLQADYIIPGKNPATDKYLLSAAVQKLDIAPGTSYIQKIAGSYITSIYGIQQTATLTLQHERWALTDQPYQSALMLVPSILWSKIYKNDQARPTKGFRVSLNLLGTPELAGGSSFIQTKLSAKAIYPIFRVDRLIGRIDLGYTAIDDINKIPLSYAFLAGGTESIRGYSFNSIGPGSKLFVSSIEFRQRITGAWYVAAFMDAGNVSDRFSGNLKKSIGLGPTWESPVGTLQLTIAQAMDSPGKPLMVQFRMGPDL